MNKVNKKMKSESLRSEKQVTRLKSQLGQLDEKLDVVESKISQGLDKILNKIEQR
ncbi:MAG: hypothetical protein ACKO96_21615 [Flammeovirgaceae bacterium]